MSLHTSQDGDVLVKVFSWTVVSLSILNSFMGSLAALKMVVALKAVNSIDWYWTFVFLAGTTMGTCAIWATHNVGMAAVSFKNTESADGEVHLVEFEPLMMISSAFAASLICAIGIHAIARHEVPGPLNVTTERLLLASFIVGIAAFVLHYTAMDAQQGNFRIEFNTGVVLLSLVVGVAAAFAGLKILFHMKRGSGLCNKLLSAAGLAAAWILMHYVGVFSATYYYSSTKRVPFLGLWSSEVVVLEGFWTTIAASIVNFLSANVLGHFDGLRVAALTEATKLMVRNQAASGLAPDQHTVELLFKLHHYDESLAELEDASFSPDVVHRIKSCGSSAGLGTAATDKKQYTPMTVTPAAEL